MTIDLKSLYSSVSINAFLSAATEALTKYFAHADEDGLQTFSTKENLAALTKLAAAALDNNKTSDHMRELTTFKKTLDLYLTHQSNFHSPGYMGHQVPPPLPLGAAMDAVVSVLNQGMAVAEMSPFATAMELAVTEKLCGLIGWDPTTSGGVATGGGTLANMTAILAARNRTFPSFWQAGCPPGVKPCLLASREAHYSVARSAGILGLGMDSILPVDVDANRRMTGKAVEAALSEAKQAGRTVFCVVASAPSTPIGAIDYLMDVGEVCRQHGVWYHVDAVHGAPFLFSRRLKSRLRGIELADSVSWDAHKMMHVASLCSFILYREKAAGLLPFENKASYLYDESAPGAAYHDLGRRTFECTKRAMTAPVWSVWAVYGPDVFANLCESLVSLTSHAYEWLQEQSGVEARYAPDSNIVVFRLLPIHVSQDINRLQKILRRKLHDENRFYITQTQIDGQDYLRVTFMNPRTELADFQSMIRTLLSIARGLTKDL